MCHIEIKFLSLKSNSHSEQDCNTFKLETFQNQHIEWDWSPIHFHSLVNELEDELYDYLQ